ncbi:MAG: Mur ligase family protein [Candidatus Paceibacterota bacterium]
MEFWAYPYLIGYLAILLFWMLGSHKQILFWLYLWQLKEYHWGRFFAHFETAKGKSLFFNWLFIAKILILVAGIFYFVYLKKILLPLSAITILFFLQGARSLWGILRLNLLHPELTKKSRMLILASHIVIFGSGFVVFNSFLGEMVLFDIFQAAILLLILDILLPAMVGLTVLILQPLTIRGKNMILDKARDIIGNRPDLTTIGITGSYGKSVTKELLAHILSKRFSVLKTKKNQNTEIGIAQTIIGKLNAGHRFFVCEIGAVHKGRIKQVSEIVKPKIAILTGINQQHLGVFGSQQSIIDGKFEIMETVPEFGTAIINYASRLLRENFESQKQKIKAKNIILVGKDIWASDIKISVTRLLLSVNYKDKKIILNTNARGKFMVEPILLAAAVALAAGMELAEIAEILNRTDFEEFNIKFASIEAKTQPGVKMNILDSTYSSNPDGVMAHLDYLNLFGGKKAVILPCLIELGKNSKDIHYQIGQKIGQTCDLAVITTKDRFREIKKGALAVGMEADNIFYAEKPARIKELFKKQMPTGTTILLEGRIAQSITDVFSNN